MLDARAGSPPSAEGLLRDETRRPEKLEDQLEHWEEWAAEFARLRQMLAASGGPLRAKLLSESELRKLRDMYEPDGKALSEHFLMALPTWVSHDNSLENWRTSLRERGQVPFAVSDPFRE